MDFTRGPVQQHSSRVEDVVNNGGGDNGKEKKKLRFGYNSDQPRWFRFFLVALLWGATIVVIALAFLIHSGGENESKYVDKTKYQAVFLNGGVTAGGVEYSTYFGKIVALNNSYVILQDVYYITTTGNSTSGSASSNSSNIQLTKLGCQQLHAPYDQMILNRGQIAFWENLQPTGKVATTITNYEKSNPNPSQTNCNGGTGSSSTNGAAPANSTSNTTNTTNTTH